MLNQIASALLATALIFTIACTSDEKKVAVQNDSSIQHSDMQFDAKGSDSKKIEGLATINFEYDGSRLTADAKAKLAENAEWIRKHKGVTVQIEAIVMIEALLSTI